MKNHEIQITLLREDSNLYFSFFTFHFSFNHLKGPLPSFYTVHRHGCEKHIR